MTEREITCIVCPIGCKILVKLNRKKVDLVTGYKCKRGIEYATHEALDPKRMLTTSILIDGGEWPLVSVKTSKPVSKEKIWIVLDEIKNKHLSAPIESGRVVIKNVAETNIDIVTTKSIDKKRKSQ